MADSILDPEVSLPDEERPAAMESLPNSELAEPEPEPESSPSPNSAPEPEPTAPTLPLIQSLSVRTGSTRGGTRVLITGTGFVEGTQVKLDNVEVPTEYRSPTSLEFVTLARDVPGPVDVGVTNPDGLRSFVIYGFSYTPPPRLLAVEPPRAPLSGGLTVELRGADFAPGSRVRVGASFPQTRWLAADRLEVDLDPHPAGLFDVEVLAPGGDSTVLPQVFRFDAPPVIQDLIPASGPQAGGITVKLRGSGLLPGCGVSFFGSPARVTWVSEEELSLLVPPRPVAGPVLVQVVNPNGFTAELSAGFSYDLEPPPQIHRVHPATGPIGARTAIQIFGEHFCPAGAGGGAGAGAAASGNSSCMVLIGGQVAKILSATPFLIETTVPPLATPGAVDIEVKNLELRSHVLKDAFEFRGPPSVGRVKPEEGTDAGGLVVTVTGQGFEKGCVVELGGLGAQCEWVSSTELRVTTPPRSTAVKVDVGVINPDGLRGTLERAFNYVLRVAPQIQGVQPNFGPVVGGARVTVLGEHLERVKNVIFGGQAVEIQSRRPGELVFVTPPRARDGLVDIELRTTDGLAGMRKNAFRCDPVPPPLIESVVPNRGAPAGGTELTLSGRNFFPGCAVLVSGKRVEGVALRNSTTLVFKMPKGEPGAMVDVAVRNATGQETTSQRCFLYDPRYR